MLITCKIILLITFKVVEIQISEVGKIKNLYEKYKKKLIFNVFLL